MGSAAPIAQPSVEELGERTIDVSCALLDQPQESVVTLRRLLSRDERARADRFRFPRDRDRYTVGRASLRVLLGAYLAAPPESLRFAYSEHRKPALSRPRSRLSFNLSHSD